IFLVRLDGAQHRWQAQKRFYLLRSEEHTSELQSLTNLVCSLLLEKTGECGVRPSGRPCRARSSSHSEPNVGSSTIFPIPFFFNKRRPPETSPFSRSTAVLC